MESHSTELCIPKSVLASHAKTGVKRLAAHPADSFVAIPTPSDYGLLVGAVETDLDGLERVLG